MTDTHSAETRSYNMSRVKNKNTQPELLVRKHLHAQGFRYRLHRTDLPGKPDIVLPGLKTVVFVHGCFWHGHPDCRYAAVPKTRTEWWQAKIERNRFNDAKVEAELTAAGWQILRIWGCDLKPKCCATTLASLVNELTTIKASR